MIFIGELGYSRGWSDNFNVGKEEIGVNMRVKQMSDYQSYEQRLIH